MDTSSRSLRRSRPVAVVGTAGAVAVVSGAIALIDDVVPVLSLGVLYVLAVLVVAIFCGSFLAVLAAVASMLVFNFFFLPPYHTLRLDDGSNWFALAVYVATAVVVGTLAARSRHRAEQAEQRERETALLADVAADLLGGTDVAEEAARVEARTADVLGVSSVRVDGDRVSSPPGEKPRPDSKRRVLPGLEALLAIAREREQLAREAVEAEALRRSDAVKTAVIRAVSHDLRTPLATIEAALDGLQDGTLQLSDADREGLLDSVRLEHTRLKHLVEDLLDLSRLQAGAARPIPELWPVDELLETAIAGLPERDRIDLTVAGNLPDARVDAVHVQRILVNLLANALQYSPPETRVTLEAVRVGDELVVRIRDRGPGIPEDERDRIFEPFHRLSADRRGAGLGLAIARGFAEANGGRISLERGDEGAVFALSLPGVERPVGVTP